MSITIKPQTGLYTFVKAISKSEPISTTFGTYCPKYK